jgi:3'-phosphoadenosine 5'-phosphosulfate sulfotransferase (PAPS reductase)/FAD synthetase
MCTQELKIRPMKRWMMARGFDHWTMVIGLRADEPRRVANMRRPTRERWDNIMPLAEAGVCEEDVMAFWKAQPFDLALRQWEGNCDLCFMKSQRKRARIILDRPDLVGWWAEQERVAGDKFRRDEPSYQRTLEITQSQGRLFEDEACAIDIGDCLCSN